MERYSNKSTNYTVKTKTWNNKKYLVVPVIMMREGVHSGSQGAVYHSAEELGKFPASWDGIPVVVTHPEVNGEAVSANSPEVLSQYSVGLVFNSHMEDDKLKADAWLEETVIKTKFPKVYASIKAGKPMDVSVGVFTDSETKEGEWNGETYIAIAHNHRPDHLALLPNDKGACSYEDGCGIRTNKQNMDGPDLIVHQQALVDLRSLQVNKLSYSEISDMIWNKLRAYNVDDSQGNRIKSCYTEAIYDNYFIYQETTYGSPVNKVASQKYYQQNYVVSDKDNSLEFTDTPIEVVKELTYKAKKVITTQKEGEKMERTTKPCSGCKEDKVDRIINNKATGFSDADRDYLMTLEEDILQKMIPEEKPATPAPDTNKEQLTPEKALQILKEGLKTTDDFINLAPAEIQEQLRSGLALNKARKSQLVQSILDNAAKDTYTKEELEVYKVEDLEKMAKAFVKAPIDYSGISGTSTQVNTNAKVSEEVLLPLT